jgi:glyoxylase-like metal-dependent hydrolase (beta-lactamase superfamily II)
MGDVLVDSATRHATKRILRQVKGLPLRSHVLTHGHMDHMGAAHEVCEALDLPLICGEADVLAVESGARLGLENRPLPVRIEHRLIAGPGHPVTDTLKEGDRVAGFSVLEVPGHAPGHLAFWREEDRVLLQLVVPDATAARQELLDRGVEVSELTVITDADGGTFFGFQDPDGNSWAVQEIKARAHKPLIPKDHVGLSEWAGR